MEFEKLLIKRYNHWEVYLHENQCYLGRSYIWAIRDNVVDFFDMNEEEKREYFQVGKELKTALLTSFNPDLFNYATLANTSPHLHTHVIPRYKDKREFMGIIFKDERWGRNYAPYDREFKLTESKLLEIKNRIQLIL